MAPREGRPHLRRLRAILKSVAPAGRVITVAVHTKKGVGTGLARRILKEAPLKADVTVLRRLSQGR